jgi:hypothetical protein
MPRHRAATRPVSERVARRPFATARALRRVSRFGYRRCNSAARVGLRFWRAVRDGKHGASRLAFFLREHGSVTSPASLRWSDVAPRVLRLVPATSPVAVRGGAGATSARCADRLRALACQFAPATMLMLARLCLRHHCHAKRRRRSWRVGRDSELSVRGTPLRCAAVRDQPRGLAASLRSVLLPETSETRQGDAHYVRALACPEAGDPAELSCATFVRRA